MRRLKAEIQAYLPDGVPTDIVQTARENSHTLRFESYGFEEEQVKKFHSDSSRAERTIMPRCWCHWLASTGMILLFLLAGCGPTGISPGGVQKTPANTGLLRTGSPFPTYAPTAANEVSTVSFTLSGGVAGTHNVHASLPTSKLRHGHREFTIDVANANVSIFLAFYGYHGPDTYTLSEDIDGGDVHIDFEREAVSWDLSLRPQAQCILTITSDTPTPDVGIDRMRGTFSCPLLLSSSPDHPQPPITVSNGHIDVAIIVES